jgi:cytochrome c-type biogenesis protein CcmH
MRVTMITKYLRTVALIMGLSLLSVSPSLAIQPGEALADPALEHRARDISKELRCLVCRNENIDESNADVAMDLRLLVRERLVAGDSDADVMAYIVERFGEYVLLEPVRDGVNKTLWGAGPFVFFVGVLVTMMVIRKRRRSSGPSELTEDEKARLDVLLKDL